MSIKNAREFYSAITADEKVLSKIADLNGKEIDDEVFNERILPVARELGYDFTYSEFIEANDEPKELSEDVLSSVSGGGRGRGKHEEGNVHGDAGGVQIDFFSNNHIFHIKRY